MTSNSNQIVELARSFANRNQHVEERIDSLLLRGVFRNEDEQRTAISICSSIVEPFVSAQVYDLSIDGDASHEDEFDPSREFVINFSKQRIDGVATFIFAAAASAHLSAEKPCQIIACLELEERQAFQCRGIKITPWYLDQHFEIPPAPVVINPRKLVKDFVPQREIVDDLSPWLILDKPALTSEVYVAWCNRAARYLLGSLVNASLVEHNQIWLQANGPPSVRLNAEDPLLQAALDCLQRGSEWVYLSGQDQDVRHLIFSTELARNYRTTTDLREVVQQALESSKATYQAHVQSSSRETIKALADLRRTVVDETQKVTQKAQELTASLWRDLAVFASPFFLKAMSETSTPKQFGTTAWFYFVAAAFILISFLLQFRINSSYLRNQGTARVRWLQTLYGIISASERISLAEEPITRAETLYKETAFFVGLLYAVLVAILVGFGLAALDYVSLNYIIQIFAC